MDQHGLMLRYGLVLDRFQALYLEAIGLKVLVHVGVVKKKINGEGFLYPSPPFMFDY